VKSEIDRPQRIGDDLHKRIDKFCASHSIPTPNQRPPIQPSSISTTHEVLEAPDLETEASVAENPTPENTILALPPEQWDRIISFLTQPQPTVLQPGPPVAQQQSTQLVPESFVMHEIVDEGLQLEFEANPRPKRARTGDDEGFIVVDEEKRQLNAMEIRQVVEALNNAFIGYDNFNIIMIIISIRNWIR